MWIVFAWSACTSSLPGTSRGPDGVVSATSVGEHLLKPPLKVLYFDLSLRNPSDEARWIVWPSSLPRDSLSDLAPGGEVSEVAVFRLSEQPKVVLIDAIGANFHAVRLPALGTLTLRRVGIDVGWEPLPDMAPIEFLFVRSIAVGGNALEAGLGMDCASETGADVVAPADAGHPRSVRRWAPGAPVERPDSIAGLLHYGVPVSLDVETTSRVTVPLVHGRPPPPP